MTNAGDHITRYDRAIFRHDIEVQYQQPFQVRNVESKLTKSVILWVFRDGPPECFPCLTSPRTYEDPWRESSE